MALPSAHTVSPVFHAAKYRLVKPCNFLVVLCFGLSEARGELKFGVARRAGKRDHVADVGHAGHQLDGSF